MTPATTDWQHRLLQFSYCLFVVTSTFSIALAQISLGFSLILFLIIVLRNRLNPLAGANPKVYLWIALYLTWLLLSALLGNTPWQSIQNCREEWLFCAVPIGIYLFSLLGYRDRIMRAFAVAAGVISLYAILQFFTGMHWLHFSQGRLEPIEVLKPVGNFTHWLTFGNYFAVAGSFLFGYLVLKSPQGNRWYAMILVASLLAMVAVVLSSSRMPIVAVLLALIFSAALKAGKSRWMTLVVVVALGIVAVALPSSRDKFGTMLQRDTSSEYAGSRIYIWSRSLDIIKSHPVFGVGQGNFKTEYVARLEPNVEEIRKHAHAHNDFLNVAAIAGIPGALFFAGIWFAVLNAVFKSAFDLRMSVGERRWALACLIGSVVFLLSSLTEATFADEEVRQMLMFLWAAGLSVQYNESSSPGAKALTAM